MVDRPESKLTPQQQADFDAMPAVLQALLEAELNAGNEIVEVGHSSPAPPAGAYFKLARPVSTHPRASGGGIDFYERNSSIYSGEFTDAKRFYFILEPPGPPPEPIDMDAIREAQRKRCAEEDRRNMELRASEHPGRLEAEVDLVPERSFVSNHFRVSNPSLGNSDADASSLVRRFRASMVIDYDKWREGIGYDLDLIRAATPEERAEIDALLAARPVDNWRDVEALAALDSPRARELLLQTRKHGTSELALAVARYAPHLITDDQRLETLVNALETCDFYAGLTQALLEVQEYHPPEIIDALLKGVVHRAGEHAVHFAAMLMFLHGKAPSSFDWDQRPFFLEFHTDDRETRALRFRELCAKIGVAPDKYLPVN